MLGIPALLVRALPVAALLSLSSCIFVADGYRDAEGVWHSNGEVEVVVDDETSGSEDAKSGDSSGGKAEKKEAEKAEALAEKTHELEIAKLELELAKLSTEVERTESQNGLARAQREVAEAQKALEQFKSVEMPMRVRDGELDVERGRFGVEIKKIELEELVAMYKNDEFAASTKEIVVKRETKELEFMQRNLVLEETKLAALTSFELPKDLAEKEDAARKADEALKKTELEARKTDLEITKSMSEAERKLAKLQKELEKEAAKK